VLKDYQKAVDKIVEDELIGLGLMTKRQRAKEDDPNPKRKEWFMHGVSHHIGLDVHDVFDPAQTVEAGMILTVEPGIYIRKEGFGVRLENLIVIGKDGNEDLMKNVPIEADEIEELMRG
jgi:Xaa-Pro aminopeptidase